MYIARVPRNLWPSIFTVLLFVLSFSEAQLKHPTVLSVPSNFSILWMNTSTVGGLEITCDGRQYGLISNHKSCVDAFYTISPSNKKQRFGMRGTGKFDVNLPQRYISCE